MVLYKKSFRGVWVDTSLLSEMKVIRKASLLKRHKETGPDGLSPSLFKDGGEHLTWVLTKLLVSVHVREQVSKG